MRRAVFVAALGLGLVFSACTPARALPPASASSPLVSQGAPELHRPTLNPNGSAEGAPLVLHSFRGRLGIVDFFAEYCQPCMRTLPELEALRRSRPHIGIVGIAEDPDAETSLRLIRELEL